MPEIARKRKPVVARGHCPEQHETMVPCYTLLARLLSDGELRRRFRDNREQVVNELTDCDSVAAFLLAIDSEQLDAQAETLIAKRQHEVASTLPGSWHKLGKDACSLFRKYAAESAWPEGHLRHLLDASEFGAWLGRTDRTPVIGEWNRVRFGTTGRRFALHIFRDATVLPTLQFLLRWGNGRVCNFMLRVPWNR